MCWQLISCFYQILQFCIKLLAWQIFANVTAKWYSLTYLIWGALGLQQSINDDAVDQWRKRLRCCVKMINDLSSLRTLLWPNTELAAGRVDPPVGSGRVAGQRYFPRIFCVISNPRNSSQAKSYQTQINSKRSSGLVEHASAWGPSASRCSTDQSHMIR